MPISVRSLYLCYLSVTDPLVETQVIAYLEGLAAAGHDIHLLTFEPDLAKARGSDVARGLAARGITWHALRYHKRPSLPSTAFDTLAGALTAIRLVRRHSLGAVHARSQVPAAMGLLASRATGARLVFDLRGLLADEYVDGGSWKHGGLPYRLIESVQRAAIRRATAVVMLTEAVRERLFGPQPPANTFVIPCCADLGALEGRERDGERIRRELGLGGRPVMAYVGKLSGRYMLAELIDLFRVARRLRPGLALLVLTQEDPAVVERELARAGIPEADCRTTSCAPGEIGAYLAAAAFGAFLLRPGRSEIAASPTKIGEYLGAGLPVIATPGVGDTDAILVEGPVGTTIEAHSDAAYERALTRLFELVDTPGIGDRCRAVARRHYSLDEVGIPRYRALYESLAR